MIAVSDSTETEPSVGLEPVLSPRWALTWRHLAVCAWFGVFALYLNYVPLYYTDLWSHVQYGGWILDHQALPAEDVFQPLAKGMPLLDSAWLGQVIFAQVERWGGPEGLSTLYALTLLATYVIFTRVFYLQTGRLGLSLLGMALTLFIGWPRYLVMRPEIFGVLALAVMFWLIVREVRFQAQVEDPSQASTTPRTFDRVLPFVAMPAIFALWANLHGSFPMGLAVLGCFGLGRVIDVAWRTWDWRAVVADRGVRRWLVIGELALVATLINPYGIDLLINTATFSKNPNLKDITEWFPLKLTDLEGIECVISWVLLMVVLRHSRRRVAAAEVLMLILFSAAVATSIRMIAWYSPVLVLVFMPHTADILQRLWPRREQHVPETAKPEPGALSYRYLLLSGLAIWLSFAFSPMSQPVLGGKTRQSDRLYSSQTPHELTAWLKKNPPQGQVWNPQWWGDWLRWDGPKDMQVFVTSMIHLVPPQVWQDYLRVYNMTAGWQLTLQRYRVKTAIVDKTMQPRLATLFRREPQWKIVYEDDLAMVLRFNDKPAGQSSPPGE